MNISFFHREKAREIEMEIETRYTNVYMQSVYLHFLVNFQNDDINMNEKFITNLFKHLDGMIKDGYWLNLFLVHTSSTIQSTTSRVTATILLFRQFFA